MKLNEVMYKFTGNTLKVMDGIIGHVKRNKKLYTTLVLMLAIGYVDDVFRFLDVCVNEFCLWQLGKSVSQATTSEILLAIKGLGSEILKLAKVACVSVLSFIIALDIAKGKYINKYNN